MLLGVYRPVFPATVAIALLWAIAEPTQSRAFLGRLTEWIERPAAAVGIAQINAIGNLAVSLEK